MIKKAEDQKVSIFLQESDRLYIPAFQRDYKWSENEIDDLIQDVVSEINWNEWTFNEHYIGAVVTCENEGKNKTLEVLDGQQRLTTFSIIFRAMVRLVKYKYNSKDADVLGVSELLYTDTRLEGRDVKLCLHDNQSPDGDHKVFRDILLTDSEELKLELLNKKRPGPKSKGEKSAAMKTKVYQAFKYIEKSLEKIIEDRIKLSPNEDPVEIAKLITKAFKGSKLVSIITASEADAFVLFETINERGLDLTASDLIKNKILQGAKVNDAINETTRIWGEMVKATDKNTVDFLRIWWNAEKAYTLDADGEDHGFATKIKLYEKFSKYIGRSGKKFNTLKFCEDLHDAAKVYRILVNPDQTKEWSGNGYWSARRDLQQYTEFLNNLDTKTSRPLLMAVLLHKPDISTKIFKLAEVISIRNLGNNTNKIEKAYAEAAGKLISASDNDEAYNEVLKLFITRKLIPDYGTLKAKFMNIQFSSQSAYAILKRLDEHKRSSGAKAYKALPAMELNVEHILPKQPNEPCRKEFGADSISDPLEFKSFLLKLGNLTLLEAKLNNSALNLPFSEKIAFFKKSEFHLNKLLVSDFGKWNTDSINKRTEDLIMMIDQVWPSPVLQK